MRIVLALLVSLSSLAIVNSALACSCVEPLPPRDALEVADSVYSGRVLEIVELDEGLDGYMYAYEMELFASWKGIAEERLILKTTDPAMCGVSLQVGVSYLVYADRTNEVLDANNCSRTQALKDADEDLEELGKPTVVAAEVQNFGAVKAKY
jgi:hypothetical protein